MSGPVLRVGGVVVPIAVARGWLGEYFNAERNRVSSKPYAYPAYDEYNCGSSPDRLNDGDLLAPGLLNVGVGIRAFYALQACRGQLDAGLQAIQGDPPLEDVASESKVAELVGPLYAVLDGRPRPYGIKATLLSKVLHRKRPHFLVLHDKWVERCYVRAPSAPVSADVTRTWAAYMTAISNAIAHDLQSDRTTWDSLAAEVAEIGAAPTHVRLLDVVAWHAGQDN